MRWRTMIVGCWSVCLLIFACETRSSGESKDRVFLSTGFGTSIEVLRDERHATCYVFYGQGISCVHDVNVGGAR